ncbi:hypothetical protein C8J57DRAFT_1666294 [Mycena rebaudengoi]|nr:hypothetical protein C8J57DRAFT_1666294 [Mycena rebaudengoi]
MYSEYNTTPSNFEVENMLLALISPIIIVKDFIGRYISPTRLTRVLVALMHETDATYIGAMEARVIPCDVDAEALSKLQIKISELRKQSLGNSLSTRKMLAEFLRGRSLSLYRWIRDVQDLKTQIEVHISTRSRELSVIISTIQKDLEGRAATHPQSYGCRDSDKGLAAPRREPQKFVIDAQNGRRFLRGRSLARYCCIRSVQNLKTRIEISKEEQLRILNPTGAGTAAWTMSARRRHIHPPGSRCNCRCI